MLQQYGKWLILGGLVIVLAGIAFHYDLPVGRLPGDIYIRKGKFVFYFPLTTCILISLVMIILMNLLKK